MASRNVKLSKSMAYLLRHGAEKEGYTLHDGFLYVEEILSFKSIRQQNFTEEDIRHVVETDDKQRYYMNQHNGKLRVRANQGHSVPVDESSMDLKPITNEQEAPIVVHGTNATAWSSIQRNGLSRMNRQHIHFAVGVPGSSGVISGMRRGCNVLIYIDLALGLQNGICFYRSANNVILSPGDAQGMILPKYFREVKLQ